MLAVGETAPDFAIPLADGTTRLLSSYRGRPVILFFFPKANTSGCTMETRGFSERYAAFQRAGVEVVGVSVDSAPTQAAFGKRCGSQFPMLGDSTKDVVRKYDVLSWLGMAKRVTFFIDGEGRIRDRVEGLMPAPHIRAAEGWVTSPTPPK
jgi:thioredoxin-dependent peroxiredoxin